MLGGYNHTHSCPHQLRAQVIASEMLNAVQDEYHERQAVATKRKPATKRMNVFLATAVRKRESSLYVDPRGGEAGEVGAMQIKLDSSTVMSVCSDLLDKLGRRGETRWNLLCGVRILVRARDYCVEKLGKGGMTPLFWLGRYNGFQECKPTEYAMKVLSELSGKHLVAATP